MSGATARRPTAGASVVVCCRNSVPRLPDVLTSLARQRSRYEWEVVLVDNASSDGTASVAQDLWRSYAPPVPLRIVHEPQPGLAYARNAGVDASRYEYVVFCDDDNVLCEDYVQRCAEIMDGRPDVGVLGGCSEPMFDVTPPPWFWTYANYYAVGSQALDSGDLTARGYLWGAGMVLRRSVYRRIRAAGVVNLLTDRGDGPAASGGDAEICSWFIMAGFRLWYDENLRFAHCISQDRLTKAYCRALGDSFDEAEAVLGRYRSVLARAADGKPHLSVRLLRSLRRQSDPVMARIIETHRLIRAAMTAEQAT